MGRTCVSKLSAASVSRSTGDSPITFVNACKKKYYMWNLQCSYGSGAESELVGWVHAYIHTFKTVITLA